MMAQISRFCLLVSQVIAVLFLQISSVSAGQRRKAESLENICGASHSGIVVLNSTGPGSVVEIRGTHNRELPGSFHCVVKFSTTSNSSRLAYSIQILDIPHACKSYLKLWGGDQTEDMVPKLCNEIEDPRGRQGRTFRDNVFYLKMVTHRDDWGFERIGFVITVTALRINTHKCLRDEAACGGGESCIYHKLYCDGVNNCGDDSDEKCLSNVLTLVSIITGAILITVIIAVFIYYIRLKRRLRPYDTSRATSTQSVQSDTSLFGTVRETYYRPLYPMGEGLKLRLIELPKDPDEPFLPPQYISKQKYAEESLQIPCREVTTGSSKSLEELDECIEKRPKPFIIDSPTSKAKKTRRESFPPTRRPRKEVALINEMDIQDLKNLSRKESEKRRIVLLPQ